MNCLLAAAPLAVAALAAREQGFVQTMLDAVPR